MNAEKFGLFLAENSNEIQIFTSENIGNTYPNILYDLY